MDTTVWSTPAMGMVPTAETVREDKYVISPTPTTASTLSTVATVAFTTEARTCKTTTPAGRVKFKVGQAGKITFVAAIPFPLPKGQSVTCTQ